MTWRSLTAVLFAALVSTGCVQEQCLRYRFQVIITKLQPKGLLNK